MGNYKKLDSADITYIKEIVKGESYIVLGEEEKEALRQAVNAHNDIG